MIAAATAVRLVVDAFINDAPPYPLVFPAVAAATLIAGPRAGLMAIAVGQTLAWWFVAPVRHSFVFARLGDLTGLLLATAAQLLLLWSISSYRAAWRDAAALRQARNAELERTVELARRLEDQGSALMAEMSHRVMNNFQMVAGFLHVQAAAATSASARAQLRTAEGRVQVLARLHSLLAYAESDGDIEAGAYVRELCSYLGSVIDRPEEIRLICRADDLTLPADKVTPLGFVISELVTNSVKYAYPPPNQGEIRVSLANRGEVWVLTIEDDGGGLTDGSPGPSGGLGTRLVERFVLQIGGTMVTTSERGVRHEITFPVA